MVLVLNQHTSSPCAGGWTALLRCLRGSSPPPRCNSSDSDFSSTVGWLSDFHYLCLKHKSQNERKKTLLPTLGLEQGPHQRPSSLLDQTVLISKAFPLCVFLVFSKYFGSLELHSSLIKTFRKA